MTTEPKIHPNLLDFPEATGDLSTLTGTETILRLTGKAEGFELLADLHELRTLWCSAIDTSRIDIIQQCSNLEALYIEEVRAKSLEGLERLSKLSVLSIEGATRVGSLDWLAQLPPLTQLRLEHFPTVGDLSALRSHPHLDVLDVSGSMWTRMKVESFQPVGDLLDLRILYLTNIQATDGSLRPLRKLVKLSNLNIASFYTWQEFAGLSAFLRDTECSWFAPFVDCSWQRCDSCGTHLVLLTGKGLPTVCPQCRRDRVETHAERFQKVAQQALNSN